jgi:hypothetical protein
VKTGLTDTPIGPIISSKPAGKLPVLKRIEL